jgi:hypothetical protein
MSSAESALRVTVSGWEDGQRMEKELDDPDRWAVQACESVRARPVSAREADEW